MMRRLRGRTDRGAAAVELALVLPLLLLILFGTIDFGRLLYTKVELSSAAREGARVLALGHPGDVQTRVDLSTSLSAVTATATSSCPGEVATVHLTTDFQWITPIGAIADMFGVTSLGDDDTMPVSADGSMRCGL
jgi:hypothetical protein